MALNSLAAAVGAIASAIKNNNANKTSTTTTTTTSGGTSGGTSSGGGGSSSTDSIKQQMQANSNAWKTASAEERKRLEAENQKLGASINATYNSSTGKWSDSAGNNLYSYSNTGTTGTSGGSNSVIQQMQANSNAWKTASAEERKRLEAENQRLGASINATYNPATGTWSAAGGGNLYGNAKETTYYDKNGNSYTGYIVNGKTYKDASGSERVDTGSLVNTNGKWYELGENGGFEVPIPDFMIDEQLSPEIIDLMNKNAMLEKLLEQEKDPQLEESQAQMNEYINTLKNLSPDEVMSTEEAIARAYAQLGGAYDASLSSTLDSYNKDAIARGMFGQLPTEALKQNAIAANELSKNAAINSLAEEKINNDFTRKQQLYENDVNKLNTLFNMSDKVYSNAYTAQQNEVANRINTLGLAIQQQTTAYNQAVDRLNVLGYADDSVANVLGVPVGTKSQDARVLEAQKAYEKELSSWQLELDKQKASYQLTLDKDLASFNFNLDKQMAAYKNALSNSGSSSSSSRRSSSSGSSSSGSRSSSSSSSSGGSNSIIADSDRATES